MARRATRVHTNPIPGARPATYHNIGHQALANTRLQIARRNAGTVMSTRATGKTVRHTKVGRVSIPQVGF